MVKDDERVTLGLKDLAIVTSTSLNHMGEAIRSCDTFQQHPQLKNVTFLMYLHDDVPSEVRILYSKLCPVAKIFSLNLKKYPEYVEDLSQYRFKSIYQALALHKYKVVLGMDSSVRFVKDANLETIELMEFQGGVVLWINTENGWKIMKKLLHCALKKDCMAPIGATDKCNGSEITVHPNKFSGCHRFDQSAINLILFEEAGYRSDIFQWQYPGLYVERSEKL
uniref:Uncharacterized protein n=1 Tax=Panagrolaimus davidi TaxID=227884 RepID=A0A914QWT6_9BILA